MEDLPVNGGVTILHTSIGNGKHHYEVETFLKDQKAKNGFCMRRGDTLLKINGLDLQDLSPEMFAEKLSEASPMLTVHQSSPEHPVDIQCKPGDLSPFKKEDTVLSFCLNMSRDEECHGGEEVEVYDDGDQDDGFLLLVEMLDTSMSVVRGRGCEHGKTCKDCGGTDCNLDEVVMMSKKVSLVSKEIPDFLHDKVQENMALESLMTHMFVNPSGNQTTLKPKLAKITIYYYQSDHVDGRFKGVPVVLNFSGTDKFLRCCRHPDCQEATVSVMPYEKSKLKCISKEDDESFPFVFYMKEEQSKERIFESAHCENWFIHSTENRLMLKPQKQLDDSFYFLIRGKAC
ncbi:uncharacterized protein cltrn [Clupea harengus]|uniref:Interleukin-1 beta n=1 Tax=Clupea harengus TaxID=7950 RepID=A0A6P8ERN3_CLUHA|nr:uncharacterized protein cltrn [Clupea harengus]